MTKLINKFLITLMVSVSTAMLSNNSFSAPVTIDLSPWEVIQYELNSQADANWVLSDGNTTATQTVNADASILLSDFDAGSKIIDGTWRVNTSFDDDFMGFVFGYQDRGNFYLFDWKQGDQNARIGFAERGMSLKVVNKSPGADPTGSDLWPTSGSSDVTVLRHNTIAWDEFIDYQFTLNFTPGTFRVTVKEENTVLEDWIVNDNTYTSGNFGFYNYSQNALVYQGFTEDDSPPVGNPVPEPSTLAFALLGMICLYVGRRTKRGKSKQLN